MSPNKAIVVGIDPGSNGGIAVIRPNGKAETYRMPTHDVERINRRSVKVVDGDELSHILEMTAADYIFFEENEAWRGDGASAFTHGWNYGVALDCAIRRTHPSRRSIQAKLEMVRPKAWQRTLLKIRGKFDRKDTKSAAIQFCQQNWPGANLTPGRMRTPHTGMADALCIASYGRTEVLKIGISRKSRNGRG